MQRLGKVLKNVGAGTAFASIVAEFSLYDVDGGHRAIIFDKVWGLQEKVIGEGTHFRVPFIQEPIILDVRSKPRMISSLTGTKDLQSVNISLRILSRPEEDKLPYIYGKIGADYDERVLPSLGNEVLKAIVAQHNAEELLSKRAEVSKEISETLMTRAKSFHLILDDVSITHLTFGKEFSKAIENKVVAQQEAERQTFLVLKADQEKKAAIIRAEGEAEAAKLISKAMQTAGTGFIEVRRIDAAVDVANTLGQSRNITYLPSSGGGGGGGGAGGSGGSGSNLLLQVDTNKP